VKARIDPEHLRRIEELEKGGLFGRGNAWEHGRYPTEYMQLVGAYAYYPWFYEEHTTVNYNPGSFGLSWDVYREMSGSNRDKRYHKSKAGRVPSINRVRTWFAFGSALVHREGFGTSASAGKRCIRKKRQDFARSPKNLVLLSS